MEEEELQRILKKNPLPIYKKETALHTPEAIEVAHSASTMALRLLSSKRWEKIETEYDDFSECGFVQLRWLYRERFCAKKILESFEKYPQQYDRLMRRVAKLAPVMAEMMEKRTRAGVFRFSLESWDMVPRGFTKVRVFLKVRYRFIPYIHIKGLKIVEEIIPAEETPLAVEDLAIENTDTGEEIHEETIVV